MSSNVRSYTRFRQVLSLLMEHGPLSFRSLASMIEPKMKERRLHDTLARLVKKEFIVRRHEKLFRGAGIFYQIGQSTVARSCVAELLKISSDKILQPQFRRRELLHAESCALWAHYFRKTYSGMKVIRDYELLHNPQASRTLLSSANDSELLPDLLLIYRRSLDLSTITIAIEIERSQKSAQRLMTKLKKYCSGSLVDGVIYVCSTEGIEQAVKSIYQNRVMHRAHRIKHYANHFLMFCRDDEAPMIAVENMCNSESQNVPLATWITYFSSTQRLQRRDAEFRTSAVTC